MNSARRTVILHIYRLKSMRSTSPCRIAKICISNLPTSCKPCQNLWSKQLTCTCSLVPNSSVCVVMMTPLLSGRCRRETILRRGENAEASTQALRFSNKGAGSSLVVGSILTSISFCRRQSLTRSLICRTLQSKAKLPCQPPPGAVLP